jgi:hypothetical protein
MSRSDRQIRALVAKLSKPEPAPSAPPKRDPRWDLDPRDLPRGYGRPAFVSYIAHTPNRED